MAYSLTSNMLDAMRVIQELIDGGHPCRVRDIQREMCLSNPSQVHRGVTALIERGYLARQPRKQRLTILRRVEMPQERRIAPMITVPAWLLEPEASPQPGEAA